MWLSFLSFKSKFIFFPSDCMGHLTFRYHQRLSTVPTYSLLVNGSCTNSEWQFAPGFSALINCLVIFCMQPTVTASATHSSHSHRILIYARETSAFSTHRISSQVSTSILPCTSVIFAHVNLLSLTFLNIICSNYLWCISTTSNIEWSSYLLRMLNESAYLSSNIDWFS